MPNPDADQILITSRTSRVVSKVPDATAAFWIAKLLSTAMGESVSDALGHAIGHVPAVLVGATAFAVALVIQLRCRRYSTWAYWITVAMVGIFGTMAADVVHGLGVPLPISTALYAVILGVVFSWWYLSEKTLSIHSIYTRRRELFYWGAVVATFALGTAAGDLTASTFRLGYLVSAVLFILIIAIPAVWYWKFGMNSILAFWFAYVITRPVGASFADWMAAPARRSGLGWGTAWVGGVLALAVLGCIGFMALTGRDKERPRVAAEPR
jgi:uncharacterized membrane-anchored protein